MIKDNIYQIFIKKISLNSFNIFIFIYFKILKNTFIETYFITF